MRWRGSLGSRATLLLLCNPYVEALAQRIEIIRPEAGIDDEAVLQVFGIGRQVRKDVRIGVLDRFLVARTVGNVVGLVGLAVGAAGKSDEAIGSVAVLRAFDNIPAL